MKKFNKLYILRVFVAIFTLLISLLGVFGVNYSVKILNLQILPLIQRNIVDFSIVSIILLACILLLTIVFGRLYCSTLCPLGILQEIAGEIFHHKNNKQQRNLPIKYFILAIVLGGLFVGTSVFAKYFDPYTLFGNIFSVTILGIVFAVVLICIVIIKNRFFCTNICPIGAILGLISKFSVFKINIPQDACVSCGNCAKVCPSGCIDFKNKTVDNETCVKCLKCLNSCPKGGIAYSKLKKEPVKFNFSRRVAIISVSAVALLGVVAKAGIELKDKIAEKIKDIILPAGAESESRILNTCLNCNLCVDNCPNKILKKSDENFGAIHIDYSNSFCKYDCNNCSSVCPAGAIKKITLEEKQKTQIAIAMIKSETCIKCMSCVEACPKHAITFNDGKIQVDGTKCIGCGACKYACKVDSIEIFAVSKQSVI